MSWVNMYSSRPSVCRADAQSKIRCLLHIICHTRAATTQAKTKRETFSTPRQPYCFDAMSSHKLLGIAVASDTESPSQSPGECVQMQSKRSRFWRRVSQSHLPRWPKFGPRFVLVLSIAISLAVVFVLYVQSSRHIMPLF